MSFNRVAHRIARRNLRCADEERDIPKTVKRYVEEHKEQGMDESKAWAIAWSRYCRYTNPDSPRCKKDPDEYFKGRGSSRKCMASRIATKIASNLTERISDEDENDDGSEGGEVLPIDPKEQKGRELAREYGRELAEKEREILLRFQQNEHGTPQVVVEDSWYPRDYEFSVTQIPRSFAIFARTVDYWSVPEDEVTDVERHITHMEGKEYKSASLASFNDLDSNTRHEIVSWLQQLGEDTGDVALSEITITSDHDKQYFLDTKLKYEGDPNQEAVDRICETAPIRRPVVIDNDQDTLVDGRHRMAAALQCGLDVPAIFIDRGIAGRIAGRFMKAYRLSLPSILHDKIREYTSKLSQKALRPFPTDDPTQFKYRMIRHLKQEISPFLPEDSSPTDEAFDRLVSDLIREGQLELTQDLMERAYSEVLDEQLDQVDAGLIGQLQSQLNDMTEEAANDVVDLPSMKSAVRLLTKLGISEYEAQQMLDELVKRLEVEIPFDDQQIDSLINSLLD